MPENTERAGLRVASYNLRGLKDDARAAAAVVRAVDPDVLLLQEVPRYPGSDYAISAFARRTGLLWSGRTRLVSGTGMMTSLRVRATDSQDRRLRVGLGENPRSWTVARVQAVGLEPVTVVSVHLSLKEDQRVDHVRTVLSELAAAPDLAGGPLVVGGDVNEEADGRAWGVLSGALTEVSEDRPTFPAQKPQRRVDATFARRHRTAVPGDPRLVADAPLEQATDHLPVWVDLTF